VITPPPFIYLIALAIGLLVDWLYPFQVLPTPFAIGIGLLLIAAAGPIVISALGVLSRAKTTFDVRKPTSAIVTNGPYRFSRNPSYVSLTLLYGGIACLVNSLWVLLMVVPAVTVMHFGVIKREERYLEAKFGDEYREYKTTVRRWV
jgi:protein-S-isoprenylcysteine O-methyltransferase Ste14